jgi:amidase
MLSANRLRRFGMLFVGRRFDDQRLIAAAYAFEQATQVRDRVDPIIQSDIELGGDQRATSARETL